MRYKNFKTFLSLVDARNEKELSKGGRGKHSITKFADLGSDEFKSQFLGYKASATPTKLSAVVVDESAYASFKEATSATLVNWANTLTTPVKDQGYCGSCWSHLI